MSVTWRPVLGYEDTYEVSKAGSVRRKAGFWCKTDRMKTAEVSNSGHARVRLNRREERKASARLVHRLVWEAFRGPIPAGMTINHINGRKTDNRLVNLELATMSEQMIHAYATGLQKPTRGEDRGPLVAHLKNADVLDIRRRFRLRKRGVCRGLAEEYGVSMATIQAIARRDRWRHL